MANNKQGLASSGLSWDRKYRPNQLGGYLGNQRTKEKLTKAIELGKLPQTLLFEGERGTGKTTLARLLAKSLVCENRQGGEACNECRTCQMMNERFIQEGGKLKDLDIEEYDIGSAGRIDNARDIASRITTQMSSKRVRVFILDEIQKSSTDAQQVYLKALEEPPQNTYIIMCTTDPEDLLPAVRSRMTAFHIKRPTVLEMANRLKEICKEEGVNYSDAGLKLLSGKLRCIPREVIKRAEFIAVGDDITLTTVEDNLLLISEDIYINYLKTVRSGKLYEVLELSSKLAMEEEEGFSISYDEFISGLGEFIVKLINLRANIKIEEYDKETIKKLRKFVKGYSNEQLVAILKILKNYGTISAGKNRYLLYVMTVELFEVFHLAENEKINIEKSLADKRYMEQTREMKNEVDVVEDELVGIDKLHQIFDEVEEVTDR